MTGADEILEAVKAGDEARVRALLAADPSLAGHRTDTGDTPLMIALYWRQPGIVEALLAHRPELGVFEMAALGRADDLLARLDAEPSLLSRYSHDGWTLLHLAGFFAHDGLVRRLLERGADVRARSVNAMTNEPLHAAVAGRVPLETIAALLAAGADANAHQHGGYTALHSAAQHGDAALAALLLRHGADPRRPADDGRTAIDFAADAGHADVAALLRAHPSPASA